MLCSDISLKERCYLKILKRYDFNIDQKTTCVSFGYGSLYNHDRNVNVIYKYNDGKMIFTTTRDVAADDELFIDYGKTYFSSNRIEEL